MNNSFVPTIEDTRPLFTGKQIVLLADGAKQTGLDAIRNFTGMANLYSVDDDSNHTDAISNAEIVYFSQLNVALVNSDPSQTLSLQAQQGSNSAILTVEPERFLYALETDLKSYLTGYKDAVNHLHTALVENAMTSGDATTLQFVDAPTYTWGLDATKVRTSSKSGKGIRIAILDTGFDSSHVDFRGRVITSQSFVTNQSSQDTNGHGTHCTGSAAGSKQPISGVRRYGVAYDADIFIGKVLSNSGTGTDSGILAGMNWALLNECRVISMSLGAKTSMGQNFSQIYETVAKRAMAAKPSCLIVAAAGNDSRANRRNGLDPIPVAHPANCPSIMAVAALDSMLNVAEFSNGGINPNGGGVDIAAPGVGIFSSVHGNNHIAYNGTSMATPHVAGIAALWLEARGNQLTAGDCPCQAEMLAQVWFKLHSDVIKSRLWKTKST
jgi:subtilisin family serine protease